MPVEWSWTFNPAMVVTVAGGAATAIAAWFRMKHQCETTAAQLKEVRENNHARFNEMFIRIGEHERTTKASFDMMTTAFAAYREVMASQVVSRDVMGDVEDRFQSSIGQLQTSIDKVHERLDRILERTAPHVRPH